LEYRAVDLLFLTVITPSEIGFSDQLLKRNFCDRIDRAWGENNSEGDHLLTLSLGAVVG
jgi:hypothetical protein